MIKIIYITLIILILYTINGEPIKSLPGYRGPELHMDAGYINVDANHTRNGRNLFYWFIPSMSSNSKNDPLLIWFQGGPGCSGLIGLFSENGPFKFVNSNTLVQNDITWLKNYNMLWFEQPAGVGFSYSDTKSDYHTNDTQAQSDNYRFIERWLNKFPQYKNNDIWLTGESYAGAYVPMAAAKIIEKGGPISRQFKGFMIGNPVFDCKTVSWNEGRQQQLNLYYWQGLVSYRLYHAWHKSGCVEDGYTHICSKLWNSIETGIGEINQQIFKNDLEAEHVGHFPSLDPDCLYQDYCTGNGSLQATIHSDNVCNPIGKVYKNYLNRRDVQEAIHAKVGIRWTGCTGKIQYTPDHGDMNDFYRYIFKNGNIDILVYSGTTDIATVPFSFTQACLFELDRTLVQTWGGWFKNGGNAGYWEQYDKYSYATIRAAGHEAPEYQPLISYTMIDRFIKSKSLDDPEQMIAPASYVPKTRATQGSILRSRRAAGIL